MVPSLFINGIFLPATRGGVAALGRFGVEGKDLRPASRAGLLRICDPTDWVTTSHAAWSSPPKSRIYWLGASGILPVKIY
jgi:hypothetical protein